MLSQVYMASTERKTSSTLQDDAMVKDGRRDEKGMWHVRELAVAGFIEEGLEQQI